MCISGESHVFISGESHVLISGESHVLTLGKSHVFISGVSHVLPRELAFLFFCLFVNSPLTKFRPEKSATISGATGRPRFCEDALPGVVLSFELRFGGVSISDATTGRPRFCEDALPGVVLPFELRFGGV